MSKPTFLFFALLVYGLGASLSQSFMSLGGALFALGSLVLLVRYRGVTDNNSAKPLIYVTCALVAYLIINLALRPWDEHSWHTLGNLPLYLVPVFGVLTRSKLSQKSWSILFAILGAAYLASVGFALYQVGVQHLPGSSFMRNPIYYAYTLLPAFIYFAELWRRGKYFQKLPAQIFGLIAVVLLLGVGASLNRMVGLCLIVYIFVRLLPALARRQNVKFVWIIPVLLIAGSVTSYLTLPQVREKVVRSFSGNDPSVHWRSVAWKHNIDLFIEHPLFGVGPEKNGIDPASDPIYQGSWDAGHLYYAHSIYFQILAEGGIIGALLFLAYFALMFRLGGPLTRSVVVFTLISGITENIFSNSRPTHAVLFYLLLAIITERTSDLAKTKNA